MNALLAFLTSHGTMLLVGSTSLLLIGSLLIAGFRQPVHRQRVGELTVLVVLVWLAAACLPLPRWKISELATFGSGATAGWAPPEGWSSNTGDLEQTQGATAGLSSSADDWERMQSIGDEMSGVGLTAEAASDDANSLELRHEFGDDSSLLAEDMALLGSPPDHPPSDSSADMNALLAELSTIETTKTSPRDSRPHSPNSAPLVDEEARTSISTSADAGDTAHVLAGSSALADSREKPSEITALVRPVLAWTYLGGLAAMVGWHLLGRMMLARLIRDASPADAWLGELFNTLTANTRGRTPKLLVSKRSRHAFSYGLLRPAIVLPESMCLPEAANSLQKVLLHELAHIRRGDALGRLALNIAVPVLWFHPLYWWIRRQREFAAEMLADDWAASHSTPAAYAGDLIELAKHHLRRRPAPLVYTGVFTSRSQFYRRMNMLMHRTSPLSPRCSVFTRTVGGLFSATVLFGMIGVLGVQADDRPERDHELIPSAFSSTFNQRNEASPTDKNKRADERSSSRPLNQSNDADMPELEQQKLESLSKEIRARIRETVDLERQLVRKRGEALALLLDEPSSRISRLLHDPDTTARQIVEYVHRWMAWNDTNLDLAEQILLSFERREDAVRIMATSPYKYTVYLAYLAASRGSSDATIVEIPDFSKQDWPFIQAVDVEDDKAVPSATEPETPLSPSVTLSDAAAKSEPEIPIGAAILNFELKHARPEEAAELLASLMGTQVGGKDNPKAGVRVVGGNRLLVTAAPQQVEAIRTFIKKIDVEATKANPDDNQSEKKPRIQMGLGRAEHKKKPGIHRGDAEQPAATPTADLQSLRSHVSREIDLVGLINAYFNATEGLQLAQIERERLARLRERGMIADEDLKTATIKLKNIERKLNLLERTGKLLLAAAEAEMENLQVQLDMVSQRFTQGGVPADTLQPLKTRLAQAKAKAEVLRLLVEEETEELHGIDTE